MPNAIIFDIKASDIHKPILVEAAWVALDSISPFTLGEEFYQRYNPGILISLGALATNHKLDEELVNCPPHPASSCQPMPPPSSVTTSILIGVV
jgi:exodeoxyribonuclease X